MAVGTTTRPPTAASAPGTPRNFVPTYTAMLTWFGPGSSRHNVSALRNSSWSSQRRRSTSTRWAHAESPPPKLASAMVRTAAASAPCDGSGPRSLVDEVRVVRELADVMGVGRQGVGRLPVLPLVPVVLEQLGETLDDVRRLHHDAQLAPQVERAAVQIHGAEQRRLAVGQEQLRVHLQVLLPANPDVGALEDAQRRERVVHVPWTEPVLPAAQDAHPHPAVLRGGQAVDDGGVDELRMLHVERMLRLVDEPRDEAPRVVRAPHEPGVFR